VGTEVVVVDAHASEVDQARDAGPLASLAKVGGVANFLVYPVGAIADGVDEINRHVAAGEIRRLDGADISTKNLDALAPTDSIELARGANQAPDLVALVQQARHEAAADVAGGPCYEDSAHEDAVAARVEAKICQASSDLATRESTR
jgi:hypothetical protein